MMMGMKSLIVICVGTLILVAELSRRSRVYHFGIVSSVWGSLILEIPHRIYLY